MQKMDLTEVGVQMSADAMVDVFATPSERGLPAIPAPGWTPAAALGPRIR